MRQATINNPTSFAGSFAIVAISGLLATSAMGQSFAPYYGNYGTGLSFDSGSAAPTLPNSYQPSSLEGNSYQHSIGHHDSAGFCEGCRIPQDGQAITGAVLPIGAEASPRTDRGWGYQNLDGNRRSLNPEEWKRLREQREQQGLSLDGQRAGRNGNRQGIRPEMDPEMKARFEEFRRQRSLNGGQAEMDPELRQYLQNLRQQHGLEGRAFSPNDRQFQSQGVAPQLIEN